MGKPTKDQLNKIKGEIPNGPPDDFSSRKYSKIKIYNVRLEGYTIFSFPNLDEKYCIVLSFQYSKNSEHKVMDIKFYDSHSWVDSNRSFRATHKRLGEDRENVIPEIE